MISVPLAIIPFSNCHHPLSHISKERGMWASALMKYEDILPHSRYLRLVLDSCTALSDGTLTAMATSHLRQLHIPQVCMNTKINILYPSPIHPQNSGSRENIDGDHIAVESLGQCY